MMAEINYFDKCSTILREQGLKCKIMASLFFYIEKKIPFFIILNFHKKKTFFYVNFFREIMSQM